MSFRKIVHQRQILDTKQVTEHCTKGDRRVMKDAISEDVKAIVAKWYFEETRISPNKKKLFIIKLGIKLEKHTLPASFKRVKQDVNFPFVWLFCLDFNL
jgi:hypothetical protein